MTKPRPLAERFWEKVDRSGGEDSCWFWTAHRNIRGYGRFNVGDRTPKMAHRVAWELAVGPITDGLFVLHRCDNPPCVNPRHLWLGTQQDNVADMVAKGRGVSMPALALARSRQTHCKRGHEFTPENTRVRPNGNRCCRECDREHARLAWRRRSA